MPEWVSLLAWALLALGGLATYWIDEDAVPGGGLFRGWFVSYGALAAAGLLIGLQLGGDPEKLLVGLLAVGLLGTALLFLFRKRLTEAEDRDSDDDQRRANEAP